MNDTDYDLAVYDGMIEMGLVFDRAEDIGTRGVWIEVPRNIDPDELAQMWRTLVKHWPALALPMRVPYETSVSMSSDQCRRNRVTLMIMEAPLGASDA